MLGHMWQFRLISMLYWITCDVDVSLESFYRHALPNKSQCIFLPNLVAAELPLIVCNLSTALKAVLYLGELRLSGNHTVTEYEMNGEPYSQKSGWKKHSNERISR